MGHIAPWREVDIAKSLADQLAHTSFVAPLVGGLSSAGSPASLLELVRRFGYEVVERPVTIDAPPAGAFVEVFACGTAAGVCPSPPCARLRWRR